MSPCPGKRKKRLLQLKRRGRFASNRLIAISGWAKLGLHARPYTKPLPPNRRRPDRPAAADPVRQCRPARYYGANATSNLNGPAYVPSKGDDHAKGRDTFKAGAAHPDPASR